MVRSLVIHQKGKKKKIVIRRLHIADMGEKKQYFDELLALSLFPSILIVRLLIQVGSFAVFVARHRKLVGRGKEDLQHISQIIILNMVCFLISFSFVRLVRKMEINYHMIFQNFDECA